MFVGSIEILYLIGDLFQLKYYKNLHFLDTYHSKLTSNKTLLVLLDQRILLKSI
tara:strand:- start:333 stop:494 length:162 start_codon:yes stop_codon:yes gene_type:complete